MPSLLALIIKILPSLVAVAEAIFNKPKAGEDKKAWVMGIVDSAMQGADVALTGGAAETWAVIRPEMSKIVDGAAAIAFPKPNPMSLIDAQR
jgi:hypothetical protein